MHSVAWSEANEAGFGLEGALVLPSLESRDASAFQLATWAVGGFAEYGLLDELALHGRVTVTSFSAQTQAVREIQGRELAGTLEFATTNVEAELGVRYNVFPGYNLSPYLEGHVGYLWSSVRDQTLRDAQGRDYGAQLDDNGQGALTVSAGIALRYRIWNLIQLGASARYRHAIGSVLFAGGLYVPIEAAIYW